MENISFRVSSFGGFNKDDVMQYIDKANFELKEIREKSDEQVKRLQKEIDDKNNQLEKLNQENQELIAKKEEIFLKIEELEQNNKEIEHENNSLTEMVRLKTSAVDEQVKGLEQEKADLIDKNEKLTRELSTASQDKNNYDNVKDTLVKLEIDAHIRAKKLKDDAQKEADEILAKANQIASEITEKANVEFDKFTAEKNKLINEKKDDIFEIIAQSSEKFAKIQEEIASIHAINNNVYTHLNEFSESFAKMFDESAGE
ncbi:MAG: DivIVA domain-containing protein [Clostridia bacterium]